MLIEKKALEVHIQQSKQKQKKIMTILSTATKHARYLTWKLSETQIWDTKTPN